MAFLKKEEKAGDGRMVRYSGIKVRIYPTPEQAEIMEQTFNCCRYLWNQMLSDEQEFYAATGIHYIPPPARYKKSAPFLKEADSQALVSVHQNIQRAFQNFFTHPEQFRYPAFRRKKDSRNTYRTCCHHYPGSQPDSIRIEGNGIVLPKVKWVKAKLHRRPLHWWRLQYATVTRSPSGKFYCSLLYMYEIKAPKPVTPAPENTVGLKYSLSHFYVDSEGYAADPPRWMARSAERLAEMQRCLSRMEPGSGNYKQLAQKLCLLHEHIANQRLDYIHKESRRIVNARDAVCVRTDDLMEMSRKMKYGNVMDSGFGKFRYCLEYKLTRQGKRYILVDKAVPTTKMCHSCGSVNEALDRARPRWTCPCCGAVLSREQNAAINIRNQGLGQLAV